MVAVFDLFKVDADESLHRLGTAKSLTDAKKFVAVLAVDSNREFWAIDRTTGQKVVLKTGQRLEDI